MEPEELFDLDESSGSPGLWACGEAGLQQGPLVRVPLGVDAPFGRRASATPWTWWTGVRLRLGAAN